MVTLVGADVVAVGRSGTSSTVRRVAAVSQAGPAQGGGDAVERASSGVLDERTGRILAIGVIDNLVKGAAGSAIQNLNVMCGYAETAGLEALPLWP